jgi:threonine/homoserine/homoserine lactone efflux protein
MIAAVGPYQYAFVLSFGASGISQETALAVSLAVQLSLFGSVTVVGLVLLLRDQIRTEWSRTGGLCHVRRILPSRRSPESYPQRVVLLTRNPCSGVPV